MAAGHADVVGELRLEYEKWWDTVSARFDDEPAIVVGSEYEEVTVLTCIDWHGESHAWHQGHVREGLVCNGHWAVEVAEAGEYEFELRRWPREETAPMTGGMPGEITWYTGGRAIPLCSAQITVGEEQQCCPIEPEARAVGFTFSLEAGRTSVKTALIDGNGDSLGAYYVYVRRAG